MPYPNGARARLAGGRAAASADARQLSAANINPATGLASDYLNHFNEAIMLLEILPNCPECLADLLAWQPKSYAEHFKDRALAVAAYQAAEPQARERLDALAGTMTAMLQATRSALADDMPAETAHALAERVAATLRPLVLRAGAVINGEADTDAPPTPQATVDALMRR